MRRAMLQAGARAFTLVELLIVISIFVILVAIAVPAFGALLYSSERAMSQNALQVALSAGRAAAMQSSGGEDGAAVFTFDSGGRLAITPCVVAGRISDSDPTLPDPNAYVIRDVLVPVPGLEPTQLPGGWMVRGFAAPDTINEEWYDKTYTRAERNRSHWVFPETDFYEDEEPDDGRDRQTFMVRFEGGSGHHEQGAMGTAVALMPSPALTFRRGQPFGDYRVDRSNDARRFVSRVLSASDADLRLEDKRDLLGDRSADTILCRAVPSIALYNERRLASAIRARVDRESRCLYSGKDGEDDDPTMVPGAEVWEIDQWIEGRKVDQRDSVELAPSWDVTVFSFDRYQGTPTVVTIPEEVEP